ncbi:putative pre-16S rRNA nuclease [candidate division SR1 bacterium]|nr:putative pre-16S rRNA nuclease [candidate division SR1 bacterium]
MRTKSTILGIDRGSKYIGLAYSLRDEDVVFPIGYLLNDQMVYFHIADLIQRHGVKTIIIGRPKKQKDVQEKIMKFMNSLNYIIEKDEITLETMDEDYSTVESGEIISNFKKNEATDTVSAMVILERWKNSGKEEHN